MFKSVIAISLLAACIWPATLVAQTTEPSPLMAQELAAHLSDALRSGNMDQLKPLLADNVSIRQFQNNAMAALGHFLDELTPCVPVSIHGYQGIPVKLASELASDFSNATNIPDAQKQQMVPKGDSAIIRANEIASHWVQTTLDAGPNDIVGMLALWPTPSTDRPAGGDVPHVIFVLYKATNDPANGMKITQIVYGHPIDNRSSGN